MQKTTILLMLFWFTIGFTQPNVSLESLQKKYTVVQPESSQKNNIHKFVSIKNPTEKILVYCDTKNNIQKVELENEVFFDDKRFHQLAKEWNPQFKLTSSGNSDNNDIYYDSKNGILVLKSFSSVPKKDLKQITFLYDAEQIKQLIPDISTWK